MKKNYSISFVRFVSMIFIILCHILQYQNCELAWWLNVGVQIFLFISGYLYANKEINDVKIFYIKQISKILIPYYIYIFIVMLFYLFIDKNLICYNDVFKSLALLNSIKGLEHLWFIRYIIFCYLIIPLLKKIFKVENKISFSSVIKFVGSIIFFEIISLLSHNNINGTWINCFVFGFFVSTYRLYIKALYIRIFTLFGLIINLLKLLILYCFKIEFYGIFLIFFNKFSNISHLFLSILLFCFLTKIYDKYLFNKLKQVLSLSDKYSYYIYITHHVFILGNFSIYLVINNKILATLLIIILTIISSIILFYLTNFITKHLIGDKNENKRIIKKK